MSVVNWLSQFGPPSQEKEKNNIQNIYYILKYFYNIFEGGYWSIDVYISAAL